MDCMYYFNLYAKVLSVTLPAGTRPADELLQFTIFYLEPNIEL